MGWGVREVGREKTTWYTVYDPGTDEILACGNSEECGTKLGVKNFLNIVNRVKKGTITTYTIASEDIVNGRYEVYGAENRSRNRKRLNRLVAEYYALGYNDSEIAEMAGCTKNHVESWRQWNKMPSNRSPGRPKKRGKTA